MVAMLRQGRNSNTGQLVPVPGCDFKVHCLLKSLFRLQDLLLFPGQAFPDLTYPGFQTLHLVAVNLLLLEVEEHVLGCPYTIIGFHDVPR